MNVPSPTGKETWSKETISKILNNEKYLSDVVLGKTQVKGRVQVKTTDSKSQVLMKGHHQAIISKELFELVQRRCRSCKG